MFGQYQESITSMIANGVNIAEYDIDPGMLMAVWWVSNSIEITQLLSQISIYILQEYLHQFAFLLIVIQQQGEEFLILLKAFQ